MILENSESEGLEEERRRASRIGIRTVAYSNVAISKSESEISIWLRRNVTAEPWENLKKFQWVTPSACVEDITVYCPTPGFPPS